MRLVRGSHIVTRRLFEHDRAYIFQQADGRIVFAIPYEGDFTLIGTTDIEHEGAPGRRRTARRRSATTCSAAVGGYFAAPVGVADIVWSYSGVRPLYDDGATSATAATRDYVIRLRGDGGRAGGRCLRRQDHHLPAAGGGGAGASSRRRLPGMRGAWTAGVPLPGGDFPVDGAGRWRPSSGGVSRSSTRAGPGGWSAAMAPRRR